MSARSARHRDRWHQASPGRHAARDAPCPLVRSARGPGRARSVERSSVRRTRSDRATPGRRCASPGCGCRR